MTPLQILRAAVADGATLTLSKHADGYHIVVATTDGSDQTVRREVVHPRLPDRAGLPHDGPWWELGRRANG